jgi:STE24 endopeptidase
MHPLLDPEKQALARRYERERRLLGLAGMAWSFALLLTFYYSGISGRLAFRSSFAGAFLIYGAVFLTWMTILSLPLAFCAGYVREHKWGFSTQTPAGWMVDQVKGFGVGLVLGWLGLALLLFVMARFGAWWWLVAGLGMAFVAVVMSTLAPVVIFPIFHRYKPITDETLTRPLAEILAREGLKSGGFFEEDMSRRTRKENAFLAGLGRTRRVVLGDTLVKNMSVPEIVGVIGHEVGHYRLRHIWKGIAAGTAEQVVAFFLLDTAMRAAFPASFLASPRANLALVPMMAAIGGAIAGAVFGPLGNAVSRHFEKQADLYAVIHVPDGRAFITALAGLANRNLGNAYPARWVKILYYSHPPIGERLDACERALASAAKPD